MKVTIGNYSEFSKSLCSVQMRENTDQKNLRIWTFFRLIVVFLFMSQNFVISNDFQNFIHTVLIEFEI